MQADSAFPESGVTAGSNNVILHSCCSLAKAIGKLQTTYNVAMECR